MKILVLGHKGMLGRTAAQYFKEREKYTVQTLSIRFGEDGFEDQIKKNNPDYIINCIGAIPQKNPTESEYKLTNNDLPVLLEKLDIPVIHPSTDCEFNGRLPVCELYTKKSKRDAEDIYGKSKADISEEIENNFVNTKIIRTSIIGHEEETEVALLDWFLSQDTEVGGYTNHYWNGITTLQWVKQAEVMLENWKSFPKLNQYSIAPISKYELLKIVSQVYKKNTKIVPFETQVTVNKCLSTDLIISTIEEQLVELKSFFKK